MDSKLFVPDFFSTDEHIAEGGDGIYRILHKSLAEKINYAPGEFDQDNAGFSRISGLP